MHAGGLDTGAELVENLMHRALVMVSLELAPDLYKTLAWCIL